MYWLEDHVNMDSYLIFVFYYSRNIAVELQKNLKDMDLLFKIKNRGKGLHNVNKKI